MSTIRAYWITCDGCGARSAQRPDGDEHENLDELRSILTERGWRLASAIPHIHDYCTDCADRRGLPRADLRSVR